MAAGHSIMSHPFTAAVLSLLPLLQEEVPTVEVEGGGGRVRTVGLPGHLVKIEMVNFMCHEHFNMEFG